MVAEEEVEIVLRARTASWWYSSRSRGEGGGGGREVLLVLLVLHPDTVVLLVLLATSQPATVKELEIILILLISPIVGSKPMLTVSAYLTM